MSDVKIGSLFMELGFDVDQVKLNDVVQSIGKLNFNSVLAGLGVAGLVDGLKQIMEIGSGVIEPMYEFNKETGLSSQKMRQWTEYAEKMGDKGDVVAQSLAGLQKKVFAMQATGDPSLLTGLNFLNKFGANIDLKDLKDPFVFLNKAVEGLQKVPKQYRTSIADLLGLNNQLLLIKSFKDADLLPAPTELQVNAIKEYSKAWSLLRTELEQVVTDITAEFAPSLEYLGNVGTKVFSGFHKNSDQLRLGIEEWVGIIALATGPLAQIGFIIAEIALHLKEIKSFSSGILAGGKGLLNNYLTGAQNNILAPIGLTPHIDSAGRKSMVQNNTISIVAHNIEDLEHKVAAFFEKTIAKSFYQNSQNY